MNIFFWFETKNAFTVHGKIFKEPGILRTQVFQSTLPGLPLPIKFIQQEKDILGGKTNKKSTNIALSTEIWCPKRLMG